MNRREQVLSTYKPPKLFPRVVSFVMDAALFLLSTLLLSLLISFIFINDNSSYVKNRNLQLDHIDACQLAYNDEEKGSMLYTPKELLAYEEDNVKAVDVLSYYYLSYLTGNDSEASLSSLEKDTLLSNGQLPKDYYVVSWFNENVLNIGKDPYFILKDNNPDLLGVISPEYLEDALVGDVSTHVVKDNNDLYDFIDKTYNDAVDNFFNLGFIKKARNQMSIIDSVITFSSLLLSGLIFYVFIPLGNKFGYTLGRKAMGLILVNDDGFLLKKYKVLIKFIPVLVIICIVSFVSAIMWQMISCLIVLLTSLTLGLFTRNKQSLSDYMARTIMVSQKGAIVCSNYDDFSYVFAKMIKEMEDEQRENSHEDSASESIH